MAGLQRFDSGTMPGNQPSRGVILLMIVITSFINPFLGAAINIALPAIGFEFSIIRSFYGFCIDVQMAVLKGDFIHQRPL